MANEQTPLVRVLSFYTTYERQPVKGDPMQDDNLDAKGFKTDAKGRRIMENIAVDWCTFAPAHSPLNTSTSERIKHMEPTEEILAGEEGEKTRFMVARWSQIEPAYEAWKAGQEIPLNGTPLALWAGINSAQADVFRQCGIRTVEEVRDLTDSQLDKVRLPNMRDLRKTAAIFLQNNIKAEIAQREIDRDQKVADLEERLAAAMDLLEEKTSPVDGEVAGLRAQLDAAGVKYHHKANADTLRGLLDKVAA